MDEGVIEGGKDVRNTEDELALSDLGAERDSSIFLWGLGFFGRLCVIQI